MRKSIALSEPLDQPERLRCKCGCDYFKINLEGEYIKDRSVLINSVECEECHDIFCLEIK